MAGSEPFENPLVPNARLKQMLLAMHRVRAMEQALPLKRRSGSGGLEACLVAPGIALNSGDLVSDCLAGSAVQFLRGTALLKAIDPATSSRKAPVFADAGPGSPLPSIARAEERIWAALGAAAALKSQNSSLAPETDPDQKSALVCYLRDREIAPATLGRALQFAQEQRLPVFFVALPSPGTANGGAGAVASRCGVPAISVDRDDAIAIFRVSQESLGRARAGGGPALMECVAFVPRGAAARQTSDPLSVIERYVLERKIVTPEWIAREARAFARHLPRPVH